MKKVAIILSGCGNRDGSELQESISLMLAIDRKGWEYQCFAPEGLFEVVSYVDDKEDEDEGKEEGSIVDVEQRDIYEESARVARGALKPLSDYRVEDYDVLALPGGLGAARNLSSFQFDGPNMTVIDGVLDAILATYRVHKPIVAVCIAPIVIAKVLGRYGVHLTLGSTDCVPAKVAQGFGAVVEECGPTDVCVDAENRIYTTPAYMVATHVSQIFDGVANLVDAIAF